MKKGKVFLGALCAPLLPLIAANCGSENGPGKNLGLSLTFLAKSPGSVQITHEDRLTVLRGDLRMSVGGGNSPPFGLTFHKPLVGTWIGEAVPAAPGSRVPLVLVVAPGEEKTIVLDFESGAVVVPDGGTPDATADGGVDTNPPETTPDVVPDATPDGGGADGTPDVVPDVTPDGVPDVAPDVVPDAGEADTNPPTVTTGTVVFKCTEYGSVPIKGLPCVVAEVNLTPPSRTCTGNSPYGVCEIVALPLGVSLRFVATLTGYATASWPSGGASPPVVLTSGSPRVTHQYTLVKNK